MKRKASFILIIVITIGFFSACFYFYTNYNSIEYVSVDSLYLGIDTLPKGTFYIKDPTLSLEYPRTEYKYNYPLVPNEETAAKIAEIVWVSIYGEKIYNQKPYCVNLIKDSIWVVNGSVPAGGYGENAYIEIRKKDGKILKVLMGC